LESNFREMASMQHRNFEGALGRSAADFSKELERIRLEFERMIHSELRVIRQRAALAQSLPVQEEPARVAPAAPPPDALLFAQKFRGPEAEIKERQKLYLPYFRERRAVLDIGCGRGEFLALMRDGGVAARGIDLSAENVALCRSKGLPAEVADLFGYLAGVPDGSLDGIFCAQVVEHLPPDRLPEMIRLASSALAPGGVLAIETPNPECLAIFAVHFYLDPTHVRPVPHALLAFYMEEHGLGQIEVLKLSPAIETMPALAALPEDFREAFFDGLDYAIIGRKL
jgi:O-antigen chain-terminating methyltransferase